MVLVIIIGNIDLSVGSLVAFLGALSAMVYNTGIGVIPTLIISLIFGALVGTFQAFWIAYMRIPAFIVTLAGMLLFRGLTYIITNVTPISLIDDKFKQIASGSLNIKGFTIAGLDGLSIVAAIVLIVSLTYFTLRSRQKHVINGFTVYPFRFTMARIISLSALILFVFYKFSAYRGIPTVFLVLIIVTAIFCFYYK